MADFKILGVSGGTRKGSYNTLALRAAQELAPAGVVIELADVSDLPLYHEDLRLAGYPPATQRFRQQVTEADAILFATRSTGPRVRPSRPSRARLWAW